MGMTDDFATLQARHLMQCWSAQRDYAPIAVDSAEGCWIHTTDGRRIFDLRSAHECINLGFRHPKVLAAMRAQMEKVVYVTDDFATEPTARLARRLAELAPGDPDKRVFFSQSGAAAIEAAIKGARQHGYVSALGERTAHTDAPQQYPYPYKIVSRYRSWHGATAGASSASGDPRRWFQEPLTVPGVVFAPDANAYRSPFGEGAAATEANPPTSTTSSNRRAATTRSRRCSSRQSSDRTASSRPRTATSRGCGHSATAGASSSSSTRR